MRNKWKKQAAILREVQSALAEPVRTFAPAKAGTTGAVPMPVIAAISGAVAAMLGDGARVVGVQPAKKARNESAGAWKSAALLEYTRPF